MRGPIRCGGCGSMVTADVKIKVQKNGNRHEYVYYHCSQRRTRKRCPEIGVKENDLHKQAMELLAGVEIPQEFYEWAMDVLRESNKVESVSREKITDNQRAEYDKCVRVIDALIDMRARGEITEEEFTGRKSSLLMEKHRLQGLLRISARVRMTGLRQRTSISVLRQTRGKSSKTGHPRRYGNS